MPFKLGQPRPAGAGRSKLRPTKSRQAVIDRLEALGCDLVHYLALTVSNKVPCGVCRGEGKTKFQAGNDNIGTRVCQSCWGSKLERLKPSERADAAGLLMKYCYPAMQSIEVSNPDGTLRPSWEVVILEAKDGK